MESEVGSPGGDRRVREQAVHPGEELRLREREALPAVTPCAMKNAAQSKCGVTAFASASETKWYWFFGSRSATRESECRPGRFERHDLGGLAVGLTGRHARQREHPGDVRRKRRGWAGTRPWCNSRVSAGRGRPARRSRSGSARRGSRRRRRSGRARPGRWRTLPSSHATTSAGVLSAPMAASSGLIGSSPARSTAAVSMPERYSQPIIRRIEPAWAVSASRSACRRSRAARRGSVRSARRRRPSGCGRAGSGSRRPSDCSRTR